VSAPPALCRTPAFLSLKGDFGVGIDWETTVLCIVRSYHPAVVSTRDSAVGVNAGDPLPSTLFELLVSFFGL
jgi:hypothetical protein